VRNAYPNVPVIIMTSRGSEEIAVEALQSGAAGYVTKKQIRQQLGEIVKSVLNANHRNRDQERIFEYIERNELSLRLENDRNRLPAVISYLQDAAAKFGLCEDREYARLGVALEEALLNALTHGNLEVSSELRQRDDGAFDRLIAERQTQEPYASRRIHVQCLFTKEAVTIRIRDEGPGFDPSKLPDPTNLENLLKPSGRGVLLMRSFMDRLEYNETGNEVTLTRFARSEEESPATKRIAGTLPLPV
jgi:anti-sigma regulatory factor (Ser/Thr protein kinase)